MSQLDKTYEPKQVQSRIWELWESGGYFRALPDGRDAQARFCIVIPPPNVTGALHLGHALNNTLQDVLIRWHRMRGDNTLWLPGTDHAGIATQAVVEKRLYEEEGKTRHELGRTQLVKRIWQWKEDYEARIIRQLKLMGCSCDYERTRFTLDEGCSQAVRTTFFKLFREGYIFRGKRLVNWDCDLQTAVADDEVYHETIQGKFYHFRYPLKDSTDHLVIATTRPETMLGDTAVAVNPDDPRYRHLVGKQVVLPLMNREIPVIADAWADPELGSGCVKITPAHDPNDYEVGLRHNLPILNILNPDGTINDNGNAADGRYRYGGMSRSRAREAVLQDLQQLGLVEKIEDYEHDVGHSDRSKTPIEPYLSDQWFLKMDTELTQQTLDAVRNGEVRFHPARYRNAYLDWLGERRDWCISRQLWWGHRIPVWTRRVDDAASAAGRRVPVGLEDEDLQCLAADTMCFQVYADSASEDGAGAASPGGGSCAICLLEDNEAFIRTIEQRGYRRDEDVLDTWFSSALWPHSTLGWPASKGDLAYYYPTSVLITSRDIITLWVVRMVLTGLYNVGKKPFHDVYIHPKILDGRGETMSKMKGNGVDPLDIIDVFGADALRFGLAAMTTETQDIRMPVEYRCPHCEKLTPQTPQNMFGPEGNPSKVLRCKFCEREFATRWAPEALQQDKGLAPMVSDKFEAARNFANKLWNAARFAFMNLGGDEPASIGLSDLPPEDRWILAELSEAIRRTNQALSGYQYSRAAMGLRDFFWNSLCDWYLEMVKYRIAEDHAAAAARQVLAFCMDQVLRLLHPVVPFITERLWQQLNETTPRRGLPGVVAVADAPAVLTVAPYPPATGYAALDDPQICDTFHDLQDVVRAVRDVRNAAGVAPRMGLTVTIKTAPERAKRLQHESHILQRMAGITGLTLDAQARRPARSAIKIVGHLQIFVHDVVEDDAEQARIDKEIRVLEKRLRGLQGKLANAGYLRSAPAEVVDQTRQLAAGLQGELAILQDIRTLLAG